MPRKTPETIKYYVITDDDIDEVGECDIPEAIADGNRVLRVQAKGSFPELALSMVSDDDEIAQSED